MLGDRPPEPSGVSGIVVWVEFELVSNSGKPFRIAYETTGRYDRQGEEARKKREQLLPMPCVRSYHAS